MPFACQPCRLTVLAAAAGLALPVPASAPQPAPKQAGAAPTGEGGKIQQVVAPDSIERIEVLRAASAEFSTQSVAGTTTSS